MSDSGRSYATSTNYLNPQKSDYVEWGVEVLANGLKTYALGTDVSSYRIITSYRLTNFQVVT